MGLRNKSTRRFGLIADVNFAFEEAVTLQGCRHPEEIVSMQRRLRQVKNEVFRLLRTIPLR